MTKKQNERFYLEMFFSLLDEAPDKVKCNESPDCIVALAGRKIGIEITEYHSGIKGVDGKPRREIEESMNSLYKTLNEKIKKCPELRGIYGNLFFKQSISISPKLIPKRQHKDVADEIIRLTLDEIPTNKSWKKIEIEINQEKSPLLQKYNLEKIHLLWNTNLPFHPSWGGVDASSIGLEENELIDAIQPKIKKAGKYKIRVIDELWLLIVSTHKLSSTMPPPEYVQYSLNSFDQLNNLIKTSGYDKVYLYQYNFDAIHEWPSWEKLTKRDHSYDL